MIKWKDEYKLGVVELDEQHKELFVIADKAYELLKDEYSIDKFDHIVMILQELKEYAIYHFNVEEKYMQSINYKKMFSHKVIHDDFIKKIESIKLEEIDENQEKRLLEIVDFIVDWIVQHILKQDREYIEAR